MIEGVARAVVEKLVLAAPPAVAGELAEVAALVVVEVAAEVAAEAAAEAQFAVGKRW